jgi:rsbT co-antagonist protein RsbR
MLNSIDAARTLLGERALRTLKQNVVHNGSGMPPFRLASVSKQIISGLVAFAAPPGGDEAAVREAGEGLGRMGLGFRSVVELQRALVREAVSHLDAALVPVVHDYLCLLAEGIAAAGMKALVEQRDEMQILLQRAIEARETELRSVIQELSTPVMPVHEHVLVVPLVGAIDEERARRITERVLAAVCERRAQVVILDITGVSELDEVSADGLMSAAKAVRLLGAKVLLVGINPKLALSLTHRDADLKGLTTLSDLQSGIEHALREQAAAGAGALARPGTDRTRRRGW